MGRTLASVRDDWIRYGLSTEPADRKKAQYGALVSSRRRMSASPSTKR